jgi:hypothetical protein
MTILSPSNSGPFVWIFCGAPREGRDRPLERALSVVNFPYRLRLRTKPLRHLNCSELTKQAPFCELVHTSELLPMTSSDPQAVVASRLCTSLTWSG